MALWDNPGHWGSRNSPAEIDNPRFSELHKMEGGRERYASSTYVYMSTHPHMHVYTSAYAKMSMHACTQTHTQFLKKHP